MNVRNKLTCKTGISTKSQKPIMRMLIALTQLKQVKGQVVDGWKRICEPDFVNELSATRKEVEMLLSLLQTKGRELHQSLWGA